MAKGPKRSPNKKVAKKAAPKAARPGGGRGRTKDQFRDIDRASVAALIEAAVAEKPRGVRVEVLKKALVARFARAVDHNMKRMAEVAAIRSVGDRVLLDDGSDLIRKFVCLAFVKAEQMGRSGPLPEADIVSLARSLKRSLTADDVHEALRGLGGGSGRCVVDNGDGTFTRDWRVDCPCD